MKMQSLERLLGNRLDADAAHAGQTVGVTPLPGARNIDVARIMADPSQPRRTFDEAELDDLAASLRDVGQQQPIRVRWDGKQDRYIIISGERRWRAAHKAGLSTVMAVVDGRDLSDDRILEAQLIENAVRSDLTAVESGRAYQTLMTTWQCSQQELAARLHVSTSKVSRSLAALDLPEQVQREIAVGNRGGTSAVQKARKRTSRKTRASKPIRLTSPPGIALVTPAPGRTVVEVLTALLEQERARAAA